jgi:hypothetical protein
MPHRFHAISYVFATATEGLTLSIAAIIASLNTLLDEESWDRLTGRHGALFVMAIALLIFWNSNRLRERRDAQRQDLVEKREDMRRQAEEEARQLENEAREKRHAEAMELQRENAKVLEGLTGEGIKAQFHVAKAITDLTNELNNRPCAMK